MTTENEFIVLGWAKPAFEGEAPTMIVVEIDGTIWYVPDDMDNRHRQMVAEWEAEGNTIPEQYEPPPPDTAA